MVGEKLVADSGTWAGDPELTLQWLRCGRGGKNCAPIAGATAPAYVLSRLDLGATVRVLVVAENAVGRDRAHSGATQPIAAAGARPVAKTNPSIEGIAQTGKTLTPLRGTWTGEPRFRLDWLRCDAQGAECVPVPGTRSGSYVLADEDVGSTIRLRVVATNEAGPTPARSAPTALVETASVEPSNTVRPSIVGIARVGEGLEAHRGRWAGQPKPRLEVRWLRCDRLGARCAPIPGAISGRYTVSADDVDATIVLHVAAENPAGAEAAFSDRTAVVVAAAVRPVNIIAPTLEREGGTLEATDGTWTGAETFTYQWEYCPGGNNCAPISWATEPTFEFTPTRRCDVRIVVTATSADGLHAGEPSAVWRCSNVQ